MSRSELQMRIEKWVFFTLICSVFVIQAGCNGTNQVPHRTGSEGVPDGGVVSAKISVTAEITSFQPNAIHDDFADGVSVSYDLTVLTIQEPSDHLGVQLKVISPSDALPESGLISVGDRCAVEFDEWLLSDKEILIPRRDIEITCAARKP